MRMNRVLCLFLIVFFSISQWCPISWGATPLASGPESLIDKYQKIGKEPKNASFGFHVESSVSQHVSSVDLYATFIYPFNSVSSELQSLENLCNIVLLDVNVRACTYQKVDQTRVMTLYQVERFDKPFRDAFPINFKYDHITQQSEFFDMLLKAPKGPFGTEDHQFELEAVPIDESRTFIHLGYSFRYGSLTHFFMESYFSIFSRGMIGFSTVGTNSMGYPVYVHGLRGAVERNVVCYYLAILAYMNTFKIPIEQRFEERINQWYDLTTRYKKQLFAMDKEEYLIVKIRDRQNQLMLQGVLERNR